MVDDASTAWGRSLLNRYVHLYRINGIKSCGFSV